MIETEFSIDVGDNKIYDLSVFNHKSFIAYSDNREIITADKRVIIEKDIGYPIVRFIDDEKFLLTDARIFDNNPNAFIYNFNGQLINSFLAGDGIDDILIHNNKIVVTYFDEGVFGEKGPNNSGLTVFNLNGEQEFGFNGNKEGLRIWDCYCVCKYQSNKVLFYAYDFFDVIELNLDDYSWQQFKTPLDFKGAAAMTSYLNDIIFHSSYNNEKSFFLWKRQNEEVIKVGEAGGRLKGLEDGRFFCFGDKSFTIIDVLNNIEK